MAQIEILAQIDFIAQIQILAQIDFMAQIEIFAWYEILTQQWDFGSVEGDLAQYRFYLNLYWGDKLRWQLRLIHKIFFSFMHVFQQRLVAQIGLRLFCRYLHTMET